MIRLPFGRHRGKRLDEVPTTYLLWLADEANSPTLRDIARRALDIAEDEDTAEPLTDTAAVALPLVIFLWTDEMVSRYQDDDYADNVARGLINEGAELLKALCSGYTGKSWDLKGGVA